MSEGLVTLKNGSVFVKILEFGTQLNLQFDQIFVIYVDIHNEVIWSNHFRILDKRSDGLTLNITG